MPLRINTILKPKIGWFFSMFVDLLFNIFNSLSLALLTIFIKCDKEYSINEQSDIPEDWDIFWNKCLKNNIVIPTLKDLDSLASIMYTSGTTDNPKGIQFNQMNIIFR